MWYSNDMFRYMFKAEFVTLVSLKVPSADFHRVLQYQTRHTLCLVSTVHIRHTSKHDM